jgi:hypothetical protein
MSAPNCSGEKIPIILSSGIVGLARVAAAVGTPYFLVKPYEIRTLLGVLDGALKERIPPAPRRRT